MGGTPLLSAKDSFLLPCYAVLHHPELVKDMFCCSVITKLRVRCPEAWELLKIPCVLCFLCFSKIIIIIIFLKSLKCSQQFKDGGIGKDTGSSGLFHGYL